MRVNYELVNFLNIAKRSHSLRFGQSYLEKRTSQKIKLIILVSSASINTKKLVQNYADYYDITCFEINEAEITNFVTEHNIKVISVLNLHIARKLLDLRKEGELI